jgi:hypothetical protein
MTRARLLLAFLLLTLVAPASAHAQATDPTPSSVSVEYPNFRQTSVGGQTGFRVLAASDASGISSVWLKVDGAVVSEVPQPCATDFSVDCTNLAAPVTVPVDTRTLTETSHTFVVGVTDGDGYDKVALTRTYRVDNTAPGAPVPLTPQQITTNDDKVGLRWTDPTEPKLGASAATICDSAGCRRLSHPMSPTGVNVPVAMGVTTLTVWLADEAGNSDPSRTTTWTINRVRGPVGARVNPGLSIVSARAGADRRTITVAGTLRVPHTNHVSVSVRARIGRRTRTVRTIAVTSGHGFETKLRLPSARWRVATVTARVAGNSQYLTVERKKTIRRR